MIQNIKKQFNQNRKLIIITIIILVISFSVAYLVLSNINSRNKIISDTNKITVETGDLQDLLLLTGTVMPESQERVVSSVSGTLVDVRVQIGDEVNTDTVLAFVETIDQFGNKIGIEVKPKITGTITQMPTKENNAVIAGQTILFEVTKLNDYYISSQVTESEYYRVAEGDSAKIIVRQLDTEFPAELTFLSETQVIESALSQTTGNANFGGTLANYPVRFDFTDEFSEEVQPGMQVEVEVVTKNISNVVKVDDSYIYQEEGVNYVNILLEENNKIEKKQVELGFRGETEVEIISGLEIGDKVLFPTEEIKAQRNSFTFGAN